MQFAQPIWLPAGLLACALLAWGYRRFDASQRAALSKFAAARLLPKLTISISPQRRWLKRGLVMAGVLLVFIALARPQMGFEMRETHRRGLELVFAIDTSKSMLAQDVKPDRLTRAKLGVTDLVARLQGDGVGLIAFAGNAFLQCPVTLDYDAFRESLNALDTSTIPVGGTNIAAAIHEAEAVFEERNPAEKILVLLTDGEDLDGEGITAAEAAAKKGVKIFTVGVGNSTGELVPIPSANGGTEFARDDKGQLVKSHLDETTLKKIAEASGGMYQPLGSQVEGLNAIYDKGLVNFSRGDLSSRQAKVPLERFQWPLLAGLLCLVADWVVGNRRRAAVAAPEPPPSAPVRKKLPSPPSRSTATVASLSAALAFLSAFTQPQARAATPQDAEQAYRKGDYSKAHQDYAATAAQQPAKPELQFNSGSAAYKAGDYSQAASGFQESLKTAPVAVQQDAYYNLGNTQYRLGQQTEKEKPEDTIKTWEEAVKSYDAALQITPTDSAAKHNRDLVKRKIERLKKQEEQKKQDQKDKDNKDQQKDNKDQNKDDKNQKDQKDQQKDNKDQKQDSKDQKDSKDSQNNSKDQKDQQNQNSKDQQGKDSKDQQGKEGEPKDPKDQDSKDGQSKDQKDQKDKEDQQKNGDPKKPEDGKDEKKSDSSDKSDEKPKDQKADSPAKPGDDKKDPSKDGQAAGKDQPPPVNPDKKPQQGDIQPADGAAKPPGDKDAASAADRVRSAPGQMTREEARQLLEALRSDERKVPAISAQGRAGTQAPKTKTIKDW